MKLQNITEWNNSINEADETMFRKYTPSEAETYSYKAGEMAEEAYAEMLPNLQQIAIDQFYDVLDIYKNSDGYTVWYKLLIQPTIMDDTFVYNPMDTKIKKYSEFKGTSAFGEQDISGSLLNKIELAVKTGQVHVYLEKANSSLPHTYRTHVDLINPFPLGPDNKRQRERYEKYMKD